jgi:hypothetical protein
MATGRIPDPNSAPITAKGDLYTYSTVPARLAVGSNGDTLVADSAATTGLRWQEPKSPNVLINSAFQVWQRGTSISLAASTSAANGYNADRWDTATGANQAVTISRQATNDSTNLPNIQYALRYQRNSGQTGTAEFVFGQSIETINSIPLAGKVITLSWYARAGANFSPTSSEIRPYVISGTGTDQNRVAGGYTGEALVASGAKNLTTTWQRFTISGTVPTTSTELAVIYAWTPVGTASTNDWLEITGVQLEVGSVATPFRTNASTLQGELAACQRYYWRSLFESTYAILGTGIAYSTSNSRIFIPLLVQMRTQPSTLDYGGTTPFSLYDGTNVIGPFAGTGLTLENGFLSSSKGAVVTVVPGGTPLTAFRPYFLIFNGSGNTSQYIGFGAEL